MSIEVKFHRIPNLTFKRAKEEAYINNWVLASANELNNALTTLNYEPFAIGWVSEGQLAVPTKISTSSLGSGINLGSVVWEMEPLSSYKEVYPSKGINEGFFYVEGKPRIEADKPLPGTYVEEQIVGGGTRRYSPEEWVEETRRRDIINGPLPVMIRTFNYDNFNIMIDGWQTAERPLLEDAARAMLHKQNKPSSQYDINLVSLEVKLDPVKRFQFAPFMLGELYMALAATLPTEAQKAYQDRFNNATSCMKWLYVTRLLEDWKTHTGASDAMIPKLPDGSYKAPTLSVWVDVMHQRISRKGFIAIEMADMYRKPRGLDEVAKLFTPSFAREFEGINDRRNVKSIGGNLTEVLRGILGTTATLLNMTAIFAISSHRVKMIAERTRLANARIQAKREREYERMHRQLAREQQLENAREANVEIAEPIDPEVTAAAPETTELVELPMPDPKYSHGPLRAKLEAALEEMNEDAVQIADRVATNPTLRKKISEAMARIAEKSKTAIAEVFEKIGEKLLLRFPGLRVGIELIKKVWTKLGSMSFGVFLAAVGIAITSAQILAEELSDVIGSWRLDENLRHSAEWSLDNVSEHLNPKNVISEHELDGRKVSTFQDLLYFAITVPADRGILSFEYPKIEPEPGMKIGAFGKQFRDVKFFKVYDQPFDHVKKMAESRNMRLATQIEVMQALLYLELSGPRGYIDSGDFVMPIYHELFVTQGQNFTQGLNKGIPGDNDGFYYVDLIPEPGILKTPIAEQPSHRKPDWQIVRIRNVWRKLLISKRANSDDALVQIIGDQWKIIYKDMFIRKGMVRIMHVQTGKYLMSVFNTKTKTFKLKLDHPVNDPTFLLMGNYGMWSIEDKAGKPYFFLKNELGLYLHTEHGKLEVSPIQPNWYSPAWEIIT